MDRSVAELFLENDIEGFRKAVTSLCGDFSFGSEDMIALGEVYFQKYPDRFSNRNSEEVTLGYEMVRICIAEKAVNSVHPDRRGHYRAAFMNVSAVQGAAASLLAGRDPVSCLDEIEGVSTRLNSIKDIIDEIPKGMIKERFVGGITHLFNVVYLMKMHVKKTHGSG
jgi:hypothetical protein